MTDEVRIYFPGPEPSDGIKRQTYLLRGEAVAAGGTAEWIIRTLAAAFTTSTQSEVGRLWHDIKATLVERGLTAGLQKELDDVAAYFKARNLAAHASIVVAAVGSDHQILRLYQSKGKAQIDVVALADLESEVTTARDGYLAVQAVARALSEDNPAALSGLGTFPRFMVMGVT